MLCGNYNVARTTSRWPLVHFFNLFNVFGIDSHVIFNHNTKLNSTRLQFLEKLSISSSSSHLKNRALSNDVPFEYRSLVAKLVNINISQNCNCNDAVTANILVSRIYS